MFEVVTMPESKQKSAGMAASQEKGSIVDDFMYGSNVATAHVYIRLGTV